ncbi:MAG: RNA-binding ATPase activator esf2 [Bogoriella megaspora]|nr:MAG: RNA-binding ATPase activator esf2 [Bogoriella megaspora]
MALRTGAWLDADLTDESDGYGYDSEAEQLSKSAIVGGRTSKRRKLNEESDDDWHTARTEHHLQNTTHTDDKGTLKSRTSPDIRKAQVPSTEELQSDNESIDTPTNPIKASKSSVLAAKKVEAGRKATKKTGVIYISRVPPFMKPSAVRQLLQPYGEIGRIFLTPEDATAHTRRIRAGGNKKKSFTDGWVEFHSKKNAKVATETLNATIIGGKKGGWYHDDVWNIKYLKGFKWHHLTEQIANENAERAARLRAEIAQTTRENKAFLQNVEKAKMLEGMQAKKNRRQRDTMLEPSGENRDSSSSHPAESIKSHGRDFRQNEVRLKNDKGKDLEDQSYEVKRVLGKIF